VILRGKLTCVLVAQFLLSCQKAHITGHPHVNTLISSGKAAANKPRQPTKGVTNHGSQNNNRPKKHFPHHEVIEQPTKQTVKPMDQSTRQPVYQLTTTSN
jgi:plastocyanin domain-containing protein